MDYTIACVRQDDKAANAQVDALLNAEGIRRDANLDYTCGMYDDDYEIIATGSCFGNTLRCMAVSSAHQGEGLMNSIVTHLLEVQRMRGNSHLFLYTKCASAKFFADMGFHEIARIGGNVVFMESRSNGFAAYLSDLASTKKEATRVASVVMNANPFTLGHLHLLEKASNESDVLHLFMVSEDASLVPYAVRKRLIMEGTRHLKNIVYHDSGPYIISSATFPSYFQPDAETVSAGHALLDVTIFARIASVLGITRRYVGEEPTSQVTGLYNRIMADALPKAGVECIIIPRKTHEGMPISASTVRVALQKGDMDTVRSLVPESTYLYFASSEAEPVIQRLREAGNVIHH